MLLYKLAKVLILCLLVTLSISANSRTLKRKNTALLKADSNKNTKQVHIFLDLPVKKDLAQYLRALNRIMGYTKQNKEVIDLNYALGLFLINVNMKTAVKHRENKLPMHVLKTVKDITRKADSLLKYFRDMVKKDKNVANGNHKIIYTLFTNDTKWIERMEKLDYVLQRDVRNRKNVDELEKTYHKWETNVKYLEQIENPIQPDPMQSDKCLASLAKHHVRMYKTVPTCKISDACYNILVNGSDIGYSLTHRLLLLLLARYARGCSVFSPSTDRELTTRFCTVAYLEAEYEARNEFPVIDLFMEQIVTCTFDGRVEFLRRSWLKQAVKRQSSLGCIVDSPGDLSKTKSSFIDSKMHNVTICGINHMTATAGTAISCAARYLLKTATYYIEDTFK